VPTAASALASGAVAPSTTVTPPTSPAVEPTGVVVSVVALDNSFRPATVRINVGDEVLWENRGLNDHNVLSIEGDGWGQQVEGFGPGAAYAHVFTEPGEYRYYCSIHGNEDVGMVGTIVVEG
jgi:plastocyanin